MKHIINQPIINQIFINMKRIILGIAVVMVAVLAAGCTHSSPKSIAKAYITALQKGDAEKAADCFYYEGTDEEQEQSRATMTALCQKGIQGMEKRQGIQSFSFGEVEMDGETAIVHGVVKYGDGTTDEDEKIATVKKDGKWYIDSKK